MKMPPAEILALHTTERRRLVYPGFRAEMSDNLVRHIATVGRHSMVVHSQHSIETIDAAIEQEIGYFEQLGHTFEWKVYSHDAPADLRTRLAKRGFTVGEDEGLLVLDTADLPAKLTQPVQADIRQLTNPDDLTDLLAVESALWQQDYQTFAQELANTLRTAPDTIGVFVAYVEGKPVSAARVTFLAGSHFAGLWGGATLPAYRGRGLYTALVAIRAQMAAQRGLRFLTVDALPTSRPILEKLGFHYLATTNPCVWTVGDKPSAVTG